MNMLNQRWHLRGIRLPSGQLEEWWLADGQWSGVPIPGARDLPGGWFLPGGLADAHAHLTMNFNGLAYADGSTALIAANLQAQRRAGVLAVRDTGLAWGGRPELPAAGMPQLQHAGRLLAPPGRGYPRICAPAPPERLLAMAMEDLASGAGWVKIMADFPGLDGNWLAAPLNYPPALLRAVVQAVHAAGGRVAAHSTGLAAPALVAAGVDTIEHGAMLDAELLEQMAAQGTAWVPTLATATMHLGGIAALPGPAGAAVRGWFARMRELLPLAVSLGVPVLAGTDELRHGALADELAALRAHGLTAEQALASASVVAHTALGLRARADVLLFAADPRRDPQALKRPSSIICDGLLVA